MHRSLCFSLILFLVSCCCQDSDNRSNSWRTVCIGHYLIDLPPDFRFVQENGIDSYVVTLKGDSMSLVADLGLYSSDFEPTVEAYLKHGPWRNELSYRFMKAGHTYDKATTPKVEITGIRKATTQDSAFGKGCDFVANCTYQSTVFEAPVYIPDAIRHSHYLIDTVSNHYRKIVWSDDPQKGMAGIYIRKLSRTSPQDQGYPALSLSGDNLPQHQRAIVLRILRSVRPASDSRERSKKHN